MQAKVDTQRHGLGINTPKKEKKASLVQNNWVDVLGWAAPVSDK